MSKYLIKHYPVYPWDELLVYDLDILKDEFEQKDEQIGFRIIKENAQYFFNMYQLGLRYRYDSSDPIVHYNNSNFYITEAKNAARAVENYILRMEREMGESNVG